MPYDKAQGTFFIRCRIKILHQPFLSYLLILQGFLVLSLFWGIFSGYFGFVLRYLMPVQIRKDEKISLRYNSGRY